MTIDDLIDDELFKFKYEDKPFVEVLQRLHEIFESTCHVCLKPCPKGKKTCSQECTYKIRSINSRINVQSGKVKNDRGLSY